MTDRPETERVDALARATADTPHGSSFHEQVSGKHLGWDRLDHRSKDHVRSEAAAILAALTGLGWSVERDDLGAAWAEAEAELPERWRGPVLRRSSIVDEAYQAQAFNEDDADLCEYAATPAAALRALAAALRGGPDATD